MLTLSYDDIVKQIPRLSAEERTRLIRVIADSLLEGDESRPRKKHSILEFEGVGAEIWQDIDSDEYLRQLRSEWDHRP